MKHTTKIQEPVTADEGIEGRFIIEEYKCLREEIQFRLNRIFKLVGILLTGFLVYVSTIFVPIRFFDSESSSSNIALFDNPIMVIYIALITILPIVAFAIEIMCASESDAITRTGLYIKDNIERKIRLDGYRGWEDWLDRQDKALRRRTSEKFANYSRYFIISIYCITSSIIISSLVSKYFDINFFYTVFSLIVFYLIFGAMLLLRLTFAKNKELSPIFYGILIVDVDGCLLNDKRQVSKNNSAYLSKVKDLGVSVIIATGRSPFGMIRYFEELNAVGLHVVSHGASIVSWPDMQTEILHPMTANSIAEIVSELNRLQVPWAAFGDGKIYCLEDSRAGLEEKLRARGDIHDDAVQLTGIRDIDNWSWSKASAGDISKIWCPVSSSDAIKSNQVLDVHNQNVKIRRTTNDTIEMYSINASKVSGVEEIIKRYKIREKSVMKTLMLGDHDNDLGLMRWADHALAPSNASISVKNLDNVDKFPISNNDDFVANALISYYDL